MTPHERFVHFVVLFLGSRAETAGYAPTVKEALDMSPYLFRHRAEEVTGASGEDPMRAAWDFVNYRMTGANRPPWMPNR